MPLKKGVIHIYTGDGKGKTTASMGLAARAAGTGLKVLICQFLKDDRTGELNVLEKSDNIEIISYPHKIKFIKYMTEEEVAQNKKDHQEYFNKVVAAAQDKDLLIMDEFMAAYNYDMIEKAPALEFLRNKPEKLEVVLTGRDAPDEIRELAAYITNMTKIRHPYDMRLSARKGIEL